MKLPHRRPRLRIAALFAVALTALSLTAACGQEQPALAPTPSVRDEFRKLLFTDRKPGELKPQLVSQSGVGDVRVERVRFTPEEGQDAVALIFKPKEAGPFPVVIAQHFLGGSKDHILFAALLNGLAQRGFMAVAIDGRYRGERQNGKSLQAAMAESLRTGKGYPWLLDTTYDITRLIDYLQTRPDVDAKHIGMTGVSEGGVITWMAAAADDRIQCAAPIVGVTAFSDALVVDDTPESRARLKLFDDVVPALREYAKGLGESDLNTATLRAAWEKLVPGGLSKFDGPSLLPQIAPRPILIQNNEKDEIFPLSGAQKVVDAAKARYQELGVADRIEFKVSPGKHTDISGILGASQRVNQFMDRWLKAKEVK